MRRRAVGLQRHREMEFRSQARGALEPDPSAVHLYDLPGHRKTEAGAHDLGRRVVCAPLVAREQLAVEVRWHTEAVVRDAHHDLPGFYMTGDGDRSAQWRELERVVEQNREQLRDPRGITGDPWEIGVEVDRDVMLRAGRPGACDRFADRAAQVDRH